MIASQVPDELPPSSGYCSQFIDDATIQLQREASHKIQLRVRQMSDWYISSDAEDAHVEVHLHGTIGKVVEAERMTRKRVWRDISSSDTETQRKQRKPPEVAMWQPPYDAAMRDGDEVMMQDHSEVEVEAQPRNDTHHDGGEDEARMISAMISVVACAAEAMQISTRSVEAAIEAAIERMEKVAKYHNVASTMIAERSNTARTAAVCRMKDEMATKAGIQWMSGIGEGSTHEAQIQQQQRDDGQAATWRWISAAKGARTMMVGRAMTGHGQWEKADEGREWVERNEIRRIVPIKVDENKRTALHNAVIGRHNDVVAALIARYSDAAVTMQDKSGKTALLSAVIRGLNEIAQHTTRFSGDAHL